MRKIVMIILLVSAVFFPLGAATETGNLGFNGGYSTRGTGLLGFNSTYQYLGDVSRYFGIGLSTHADLAFNFSHNYFGFMVGFIAGPGFEFRIAENLAMNLTVGPGVVVEYARGDSFGFGVGIDASFTYYFDTAYPNIGVTIGTSLYPQFLVMDEADPKKTFSFAGTGYIGISWRFPGYSWDQLTPPPLGYIIY